MAHIVVVVILSALRKATATEKEQSEVLKPRFPELFGGKTKRAIVGRFYKVLKRTWSLFIHLLLCNISKCSFDVIKFNGLQKIIHWF